MGADVVHVHRRDLLCLSQMEFDNRKNSGENTVKLCFECKIEIDFGNVSLLRNTTHFLSFISSEVQLGVRSF